MNKFILYIAVCTLAAMNTGAFAGNAINSGNSEYAVSISGSEEVNISVAGKVISQEGTPLSGVSVTLKGSTASTLTDAEGAFQISAPEDGVLVFSFSGYAPKEIPINGNSNLGVVILDNGVDNGRLVHTLFRDQKADEILGGVSDINYLELSKKCDGFPEEFALALSKMWSGTSMWSGTALVLVDGLPTQNVLISEDIESVTYLRGAQAVALYGSRGANGVILMTTKRGQNKPISITARVNGTLSLAKSYPELLGSAEYMMYYNQALKNDGLSEKYTDKDIYYSSTGENPYLYPDVNFYSSEYIKNWIAGTHANLVIDGGNDFATFYTDIYYNYTGSEFKVGEAKNNNSNRLAIRGNVDMKFNDYITATVDANVNMQDSKGFKSNSGTYWEAAKTMRPNRIAPLIPLDMISSTAVDARELMDINSNIIDGKYFLSGTQDDATNIFADLYSAGKSKNTERQFQFNTQLHFNLNPLLNGLSFHTQFGTEYATSYKTSFDNKYAVYIPTWFDLGNGEVITSLKKENEDKKSGSQGIGDSKTQRMYAFNAHLDYNRTFGVHTVGAMALVNGYQRAIDGDYHSTTNANLSFDVTYDFGKRYFAEVAVAIPHSAKLAEGHRNGFSKSASLGWNISNESFFNKSGFINNLMVSVSASDLYEDIDIEKYYMYAGTWSFKDGWYGWREGNGTQPTYSVRGENPDLDFIHIKELSANLRMSMLNNSLTVDFSAHTTKRTGLIITPKLVPSYFSSGYPEANFVSYINYDENSFKGIDFAVNYQKQFGEVKFGIGVFGATMIAKAEKRDESDLPEFDMDKDGKQVSTSYRKKEGKYLDGIWGYETEGLFTSDEEIAEYSKNITYNLGSDKALKRGDIKYKDQNNDGVIDSKDMVELGRDGQYGNPFELGLNFTVSYKNFTLFVAGTGKFGALGVKNNDFIWVNGEEKYTAAVRDTWTPNNTSAKYPRLTTGNGNNNFQKSDFWTFKNNRFDLSRVQLTYEFPSTMFEGNRIVKGCSVYFYGTDLLTLSKEREYLELSYGSAPKYRVLTLGAKVTF